MSTIEEYSHKLDGIRSIHTHLGFIAGVSTALALMREHKIDVEHPARAAVFTLLMDVSREDVEKIIAEMGKIRRDGAS